MISSGPEEEANQAIEENQRLNLNHKTAKRRVAEAFIKNAMRLFY